MGAMMIRPFLLIAAFSALASCGTQNSNSITGCRSAMSVGEDHPRSCANVIDQPSNKTYGEPESLEWHLDDRNTTVNRVEYYKEKYCDIPLPTVKGMNDEEMNQEYAQWRKDRWACAKKKHNEKVDYWNAYLDGQRDAQNAAEQQNGLDWLDKWQKDYNDKLDSIVKDHNERIEKNRNEARDRYLDQLLNNGY